MTPRSVRLGVALLCVFLSAPLALGQDVPKKPKKQAATAPATGPQVRILTVSDADAAKIVRTLKDLFPADAAKKMRIALHQSTNSILLLGELDDLERAESIINRLDVVAGEQKKDKPENARPAEKNSKQPEEQKGKVALAEADVEQSRERVAWSERMVKLGYLSAAQAKAERSRLDSALELLAQACSEVKTPQAPRDPAKPAAPQGWEYKVLNVGLNDQRWEAEMNKAGADGWELAHVVHTVNNGSSSSTVLLFKRARR